VCSLLCMAGYDISWKPQQCQSHKTKLSDTRHSPAEGSKASTASFVPAPHCTSGMRALWQEHAGPRTTGRNMLGHAPQALHCAAPCARSQAPRQQSIWPQTTGVQEHCHASAASPSGMTRHVRPSPMMWCNKRMHRPPALCWVRSVGDEALWAAGWSEGWG